MGQNCAIVIGINHYRNLQRLNYAKQDSEAIRDYVRGGLGCQPLYHFSDDSPPIPQDYGADINSHPTFATLRRFLRVRFDRPFLKPGDNLWFFFAGHGVRHQDRDYLMPIDADPGDVTATAISLHYVTERLQRSGADNVIMLLDACRSGVGGRGVGVGLEAQKGVITLFSCSPQESSYEIDELQQGAFTYSLLQGLKLQGEANCATVERLYRYLRDAVPLLNEQYRKPKQTPYGRVEPPTKNYLILLPQKATPNDVDALKKTAMRAELKRQYPVAKQLWLRVLAVSPADLEAVEGIERLARVNAAPVPPAPEPEAPPGRGGEPTEPTPPTAAPGPPASQAPAVPTFEFEVVTVDATGQIAEHRPAQAEYRREELGNGITLDLVRIPAGEFMMGSPDSERERQDREGPQHRVTVPAFWMGKYPVTQAQWKAVAALTKVACDLEADPAQFKGANRPVERVNWEDAVEFCQRLSTYTGRTYRLPSEAEWEYACRAGTTTPFHFGETLTPDIANYNGSYTYGNEPRGVYRQETTEVGSFQIANAFGLYDMHGNVWEWCLDHWHDSYGGFLRKAPTDGSAWVTRGDASLRVLRGGSWHADPGYCRSALRDWLRPDSRDYNLGFRVVCSLAWTL